jgi:LysM domain
MANITKHLTSISLDSRSGAPPGRRFFALTLVVMLVFGSTLPGLAWAGETDSEGEGSVPPVEVPVAPDFDPGGEEEGLEETPATGDEEEGGTVEAEAEVEIEAPPASEEVTSAATEAPVEAAPPPAVEPPPTPATSTPEAEPVQQEAAESSEPVANQSITAPAQAAGAERSMASVGDGSGESAASAEPTQQEAPSPSPQPVSVAAPDPTHNLVGKDTYVVQPGDCLWHIAARLLPGGAGTEAVAGKVAELWRLNEDRIGTGDPNLIYAGTELRLR